MCVVLNGNSMGICNSEFWVNINLGALKMSNVITGTIGRVLEEACLQGEKIY